MKLRLLAGALALALSFAPGLAQVNPGTSPLTGSKGGTNNAYMQFSGPATSIKTYTLPNASGTIDLLNAVQTFTAAKTFADATLLLAGSSSGTTTLKAAATASGTWTFSAVTDTVVGRSTTDTLTNKTLTTPVLTSATPTAAGAIGYGSFPNYGDGSSNHALVDVDRAQTLTNKTINGANNTLTARIASDVSGLGTGIAAALAQNLSATGGVTSTIASGTAALGTSAISSAACASVVTVAATGTATTDVVSASFNSDPTAVTGYVPSTLGMLTIFSYPTANNVNFKVCNNTPNSITPGAITLNWRVVR